MSKSKFPPGSPGALAEEKEAAAAAAAEGNRLSAILDARRLDITKPPPKPAASFWLKGKVIATPENLFAIQAAVKAGKSAFIDALIISTTGPPEDSDCLGVSSSNPKCLAVVHFDTEQSPWDHFNGIDKAIRRVGCTKLPPWFRSYYLADVPLHDRRAVVRCELERAAKAHGGIQSFSIDGIGDLCVDPNSPAEAFGLIDELHMLAIRYTCTCIAALHENPGSEFGKTRGHLGSQLERKAETNLRLVKDKDGVINVFTEKARAVHIPREEGVFFKYDEDLGYHVSCTVPKDERAGSKLAAKTILVEEIFADSVGGLAWKEIHERIATLEKIEFSTARKRFDALIGAKLIEKNGSGNYQKKARK